MDDKDFYKLPENVRSIIDDVNPNSSYSDLDDTCLKLNEIGYTLEYDLAGEITSIHQLKPKP